MTGFECQIRDWHVRRAWKLGKETQRRPSVGERGGALDAGGGFLS